MSKQREALKVALEALEKEPADYADWITTMKAARSAVREALAEPEQEPVAWIMRNPPYEDGTPNPCNTIKWAGRNAEDDFESETPLYTTPPARKPLTIEEITAIVQSMSAYTWDVYMLARAIERAHGIGD